MKKRGHVSISAGVGGRREGVTSCSVENPKQESCQDHDVVREHFQHGLGGTCSITACCGHAAQVAVDHADNRFDLPALDVAIVAITLHQSPPSSCRQRIWVLGWLAVQ